MRNYKFCYSSKGNNVEFSDFKWLDADKRYYVHLTFKIKIWNFNYSIEKIFTEIYVGNLYDFTNKKHKILIDENYIEHYLKIDKDKIELHLSENANSLIYIFEFDIDVIDDMLIELGAVTTLLEEEK